MGCDVRIMMYFCFEQVSVTVSFEVTVGTAQLAVVDKDQGVTTKTVKYVCIHNNCVYISETVTNYCSL